MDPSRITEIFVPATGKIGSGYIIGPQLILTALHVVGSLDARAVAPMRCFIRPFGEWTRAEAQWLANVGKIGERPPDNLGWSNAELCWPKIGEPIPRYQPTSDYGRAIDLAVLRVLDGEAASVLNAPPVQWGVGGFRETMKCRSIGFPKLAMRDIADGRLFRDLSPQEREKAADCGGLVADTHELEGIVHPAAALKSSQFHVYVTNEKPVRAELWRGMSGAPVFDEDDRLVGVVTNYTSEAQNGCIIAERIASTKDTPAFADLLKIDWVLDSLDHKRRSFLSRAKEIAGVICKRADRAFDRNLLSSFIEGGTLVTPARVFVRPEFRRRPDGRFLVPPEHVLGTGLDLDDAVASNEALLIVGEPGSGKSFAAADLARRLALSWASGKPQPFFPLLLFAKDLRSSPAGTDIGSRLAAAFEAATNQGYLGLPSGFLDQARDAQIPVLLIIDGLDEIVSDKNVANFLNWINATITGFSGLLRVALFTRPLGLDPTSADIDQFASFLLLPFDSDRRRELVQRVFLYFNKSTTEADEFVQSLPASSVLDNPAILTMLAVVALGLSARGRLETRSDIIKAYVQALTATFVHRYRDEFSRFTSDELLGDPELVRTRFFSKREQELILSTIGLLATETEQLDEVFFQNVYAKCVTLRIFSENRVLDPEVYAKVIRHFALRLGILVDGANRLVFSHNLIREYLASQYLCTVEEERAEHWLRRWRSPLWRETLQMALPVWLRKADVASCLLPQLRIIAVSTYEGGLFCGEALLERLPITDEDRDGLASASFRAIRSWNVCENYLLTVPKANPSALIRRLLREPDFRARITGYLRELKENWCPFTVLQFVRLLSEFDEPNVLLDLATSGTPFIRANAAKALLDCGRQEDAVQSGISVMKDLETSIALARRVVDAFAEAKVYPALLKIIVDGEIDTSVRGHAAAQLWQVSPGDESRAALQNTFFGTAHDDDIVPMDVKVLFQARIIFSSDDEETIAPKTAKRAAEILLADVKDVDKEQVQLARELHSRILTDPANGFAAPQPRALEIDSPPVVERPPIPSSDPYDHPFVQEVIELMSAYEKDPAAQSLEQMLSFERSRIEDDPVRAEAARFVNATLFRTGRADLLRKRFADANLPVSARAQILEQLAALGDADLILAQLNIPNLPRELRDKLPDALTKLGLTQHVPLLRERIIVDTATDGDARAWQFQRLMEEDEAAAGRVAARFAEDSAQPRPLRRAILTFLAGKGKQWAERLAALASEEPANCSDILEELARLWPHSTDAALAVVRATAPAPLSHLHCLERLVAEPISVQGIALLVELADRVAFDCSGSGALFRRLSDAIDSGTIQLLESQREKLLESVATALQYPGNTAVISAVLLWRLVSVEAWVDAIVSAVEAKPSQYRLLATGLTLPPDARGNVAERLARNTNPETISVAAGEFYRLDRYHDARALVRNLAASHDLAVDALLLDGDLIGALPRLELASEMADRVARALISRTPLDVNVVWSTMYEAFLLVLRHARDSSRESVLAAIEGRSSDTFGRRLMLLWRAASAESKGDFSGASQSVWRLCLRLPDELWLRQQARTLALKAVRPQLLVKMIEDEFSYFRRKNKIDQAKAALEELSSVWRRHYLESQAHEGAWELAYAHCKAALELAETRVLDKAEQASLQARFGWVCFQLYRDEEMEAAFSKFVELDDDEEANLFSMTVTMLALGRYDKAIACCDRAIQREPENSYWLVNRAVARINNKELSLAEADLRQATVLDEDNGFAWETFGWFWINRSEWQNAVRDSSRAIALGRREHSFFNRAFAHWSLQQYESASTDLQKAAEFHLSKRKEEMKSVQREERVVWRNQAGDWDTAANREAANFIPFFARGLAFWLADDLNSSNENLRRADTIRSGIPEIAAIRDKIAKD